MPKSKKLAQRSWWRELFADHPRITDKDEQAFVTSETGATKVAKVYCKACLEVDIDRLMVQEDRLVTEGRIIDNHDRALVEAYRKFINCSIPI